MGCCGEKSGTKNPQVDDNCIGCGACVAICDQIFDLNDEGKAFVREGVDCCGVDCIDDAIGACPVSSIHYKK